jgi:hypothetical protein
MPNTHRAHGHTNTYELTRTTSGCVLYSKMTIDCSSPLLARRSRFRATRASKSLLAADKSVDAHVSTARMQEAAREN